MTHTFGRRSDPDLDSVWLWYEFQSELTGQGHADVLRAFAGADSTSADVSRVPYRRFVGLTRIEIDEFFEAQRRQTELLTMFEILSTTEAVLRIDFNARKAARRKDNLSKRLRKIHNRKVRLDEDILAALKEEGILVSPFRAALKLRHWLAHGRYWNPKIGQGYTPQAVFDISRTLIDSFRNPWGSEPHN